MFKKNFKNFVAFYVLNFIFSIFISSSYIFFSKRTTTEIIYLLFSVVSNTAMIYTALLFIILPLVFFSFWIYPSAVIMFTLHLMNVVDAFIYKIWNFHINSMVFNIIITPGGIDSLEQSWNVKMFFLLVCCILLAVELLLIHISKKVVQKDFLKPVFLKFFVVLVLLSVLVDKIGFAIASLYDYTIITKNRNLFPLYQPLTIRRLAEKYLGFDLKKEYNFALENKNSSLFYPKKDITFKNVSKKYNIVLIVVDSMRYDMLDSDIMPYTYAFSKKSLVFRNHFSGGNASRFGIFSLFYGLYGNYWFSMIAEKKGPLLISALKRQGYNFFILASAKLTFPEFNKTCFVEIGRDNIFDGPYGDKVARDIEITSRAVSYIKNRDRQNPYFMFVFFDAAHGSYDYPQDFEKFKPSYGVNLMMLNKDTVLPLFNKYKNSIHFEDMLINRIITAIKESGGLKDTLIIITSDHGESFFEKGYYGHNHSYSYEEVRVPLVFYHPDIKPNTFDYRTSHMDIVPTLMDMIGVVNEPSDYSHGVNIFSQPKRDYIAVFSWDKAGLVFNDFTVVVPLSGYSVSLKSYRNIDWKEIDMDYAKIIPYFNDFKNRVVEFMKK